MNEKLNWKWSVIFVQNRYRQLGCSFPKSLKLEEINEVRASLSPFYIGWGCESTEVYAEVEACVYYEERIDGLYQIIEMAHDTKTEQPVKAQPLTHVRTLRHSKDVTQ